MMKKQLSTLIVLVLAGCGTEVPPQKAGMSGGDISNITAESVAAEVDSIAASADSQGTLSYEQVAKLDALGERVLSIKSLLDVEKEKLADSKKLESGEYVRTQGYNETLMTYAGVSAGTSALATVLWSRAQRSEIANAEWLLKELGESQRFLAKDLVEKVRLNAREMGLFFQKTGGSSSRTQAQILRYEEFAENTAKRLANYYAGSGVATEKDLLGDLRSIQRNNGAANRVAARLQLDSAVREVTLVDDFSRVQKTIKTLAAQAKEDGNLLWNLKNGLKNVKMVGWGIAAASTIILVDGILAKRGIDARIKRLDGKTFEEIRDRVIELVPQYDQALATWVAKREELVQSGAILESYPEYPQERRRTLAPSEPESAGAGFVWYEPK